MSIPKEKIELLCWFKNNEEWYFPDNPNFLDINQFDHFEVIHYYNDENFLVYCWIAGFTKANGGRLFKAKLKP